MKRTRSIRQDAQNWLPTRYRKKGPSVNSAAKTSRNESDNAGIADSGMPVNTLCRAVRS
ncbi:hypothetical protein [Pantoea vagans]|uniref:hypothetical protein n=1 Tax=Pantoea vagans TaxID=470934 RepID=UPI003B0264A7